MIPFKSYYAAEIELWLDSHPGRVLTHVQMGKLMASAFVKSSTMQISRKRFSKTGIMPFNPNTLKQISLLKQ